MSKVRVLVVDDVEKDAAVFTDALKSLGCDVTRATSLVAGLEAVATSAFDIAIVAWDLDDGSGLDLGVKVADQAIVVVTSETGSKALADETLGGRCADFLPKPLPDKAVVRRRLIPLIERRRKDPFEVTAITKRPDGATEEGSTPGGSKTGGARAKKKLDDPPTDPVPRRAKPAPAPEPGLRKAGAQQVVEARVTGGKRKQAVPVSKAKRKGSTRPDEDPSRTWLTNTEHTGVFDPKLTVRVWTQDGYVPHIAQWDNLEDEGPLYDVERELARGSAATVYLAQAPEAPEPVALKVLDPSLSHDEQFRMRFRREVRSHAALTHPNIVRVLDYGRRGACYFLALELMRGSLGEVLTSLGWLPTALVALFLEDALQGIHFAHRRGVLHRDLKPGNLMFGDDGTLKVADFGFAKSTIDPNQSTPGLKIGTPAYFSPEQATGAPLGPRSDLFALGTLGREMLLGKNPYARDTVVDTALAISKANAPIPSAVTVTANLQLSDVITKLSRRSPDDRYPSGLEAIRDLAPLTIALRRRYPLVKEQFMRNPRKMRRQLLEDEARLELRRARSILKKRDRVALIRGSLALYRTTMLDPANAEAASELRALVDAQGFIFDEHGDAREKALVGELAKDPEARSILEELYTRARDQGRVWSYARYLRRYVATAPSDAKAARFLDEIDENARLAPFRRDDALEDPDSYDASMEATGMHRLTSGEAVALGIPPKASQ